MENDDVPALPVSVSTSDQGLGFFYGYQVGLAKRRAGLYELCGDRSAFKSNACIIPGVGTMFPIDNLYANGVKSMQIRLVVDFLGGYTTTGCVG